MTISSSGQVVFCGSKNGIISVRRVWDLEGFHTFDTSAHGAVTSMTLISGGEKMCMCVYICMASVQ